MSTSSSGVYGKFDNVDFNIDSDILGNNAEATVNVADIISSMGNMSAINCVSSGKINVASKEIKYFYYKGWCKQRPEKQLQYFRGCFCRK